MGIFSFLPLGNSSSQENIPTFKQGELRDPTDLQVQSLLYLFKRLRINRLASFSQGNTLKYSDGKSLDQTVLSHEVNISKLDHMYNLHTFQAILVEDEHRALIDWPKNKFRALCFLSEHPTPPSRPQSPVKNSPLPISKPQESALPVFRDYKDRPVQSFAFSVLPVNTSIFTRDLALDLAQSLLYSEHHSYISLTSRIQTADKAIAKVCDAGSNMIELTEDIKAAIVNEYLKKLAFLVQLVRIYQQYVKPKDSDTLAPVISPKKATSGDSPRTPRPESPRTLRPAVSMSKLPNVTLNPLRPSLSPKKSMANLLSSSPKKASGDSVATKLDTSPRKQLSTRPSISHFRANEIYNPVTSPPASGPSSENKFSGSGALSGHSSDYEKENAELWEKCKASIREKLAKEKDVMA
ncbi:hypothetical protein JCM33374_g290 [Metschnikowia sp. JCM 33374]|nr:hypothetical protein JCM33374_g290 [Metschnikowia sp. JCM 33374]